MQGIKKSGRSGPLAHFLALLSLSRKIRKSASALLSSTYDWLAGWLGVNTTAWGGGGNTPAYGGNPTKRGGGEYHRIWRDKHVSYIKMVSEKRALSPPDGRTECVPFSLEKGLWLTKGRKKSRCAALCTVRRLRSGVRGLLFFRSVQKKRVFLDSSDY